MASTINASTTQGVQFSGDTSGALALQTNNGTTAVTIDTSQNVGIGTASPAKKLDVNGEAKITTGMTVAPVTSGLYATDGTISNYSTTNGLYVTGNDAGWLSLQASGSQSTFIQLFGNTYAGGANIIKFRTASAERMQIDASGNVLIGTTSTINSATSPLQTLSPTAGNQCWTAHNSATAGNRYFAYFGVGSTFSNTGSIYYNGTLTVYATTSDQRLKENIVDSGSGLEKLSNVKIRAFDWKESGNHTDFGVIAQELNEVAPEAVGIGEDNEDGSINKPWNVDTSVLVPAMIKAIQELKAEVDTLKAQLEAK